MNLRKPSHNQLPTSVTFRYIWIFLIVLFSLLSLITIIQYQPTRESSSESISNFPTTTPVPSSAKPTITPISLSPSLPPIQTVIRNAPFASQAPYGQWSDARFQDACEETSSLIVYSWVHNLPLTPQIANDTIIKLAQYQTDNYNSFVDTSVEDTVTRILQGYFQLSNIEIITPKDVSDLIRILQTNKLIIAPMNGQLLDNPNFTAPGPNRHMLVINGYDANTQQFITQDPGTRNGRNFRYTSSNLWQSIRDYPTGEHVDIPKPIIKRVIVVPQNDS